MVVRVSNVGGTQVVREVRPAISDWPHDVVSIGYPGVVLRHAHHSGLMGDADPRR